MSSLPVDVTNTLIIDHVNSCVDCSLIFRCFIASVITLVRKHINFLGLNYLNFLQIGLGIIRALLFTARPASCKLGNLPNTNLYRDIEHYPDAQGTAGILIIQLGSPILYSNSTYVRER